MYRVVLAFLLGFIITSASARELCTYRTYSWNTIEKKSVNHELVTKSYADLSESEVDPLTGCSVCEQDQRTINLAPLKSFKVCHVFAGQIEDIVTGLIRSGEPVYSVTGYRVGKTRGTVDHNGNRTQFSNHSYGIAIDINPEQNGLYDNCLEFNDSCRLIRGGSWSPENRGSLSADGVVVNAFKDLGLKWGGQIQGWQKDFMHFSPSGY